MKIGGKEDNVGGGIGFFGLLAVLFIGLKLTGFISWSWWWVLAPIWAPAAAGVLLAAAVVAVAAWLYVAGGDRN